jgi:hypothetical protein
MNRARSALFTFAALFAVYRLPALPAVPAARADWGQGAAAYEAPDGVIRHFVKSHQVGAGSGVSSAIFCLFAVIIGPADRILDDIDNARRKD